MAARGDVYCSDAGFPDFGANASRVQCFSFLSGTCSHPAQAEVIFQVTRLHGGDGDCKKGRASSWRVQKNVSVSAVFDSSFFSPTPSSGIRMY